MGGWEESGRSRGTGASSNAGVLSVANEHVSSKPRGPGTVSDSMALPATGMLSRTATNVADTVSTTRMSLATYVSCPSVTDTCPATRRIESTGPSSWISMWRRDKS